MGVSVYNYLLNDCPIVTHNKLHVTIKGGKEKRLPNKIIFVVTFFCSTGS